MKHCLEVGGCITKKEHRCLQLSAPLGAAQVPPLVVVAAAIETQAEPLGPGLVVDTEVGQLVVELVADTVAAGIAEVGLLVEQPDTVAAVVAVDQRSDE